MRCKWENYKNKIFLSHSLIARPQRAFQEPLFVLKLRYLNLLGVYLGNISPSFFFFLSDKCRISMHSVLLLIFQKLHYV